jgi:hypothetical protein
MKEADRKDHFYTALDTITNGAAASTAVIAGFALSTAATVSAVVLAGVIFGASVVVAASGIAVAAGVGVNPIKKYRPVTALCTGIVCLAAFLGIGTRIVPAQATVPHAPDQTPTAVNFLQSHHLTEAFSGACKDVQFGNQMNGPVAAPLNELPRGCTLK